MVNHEGGWTWSELVKLYHTSLPKPKFSSSELPRLYATQARGCGGIFLITLDPPTSFKKFFCMLLIKWDNIKT